MDKPATGRSINWTSVITVLSAAVLIGAEVFGAAYAGSWAIATLFGFEGFVARILDILFLAFGSYVMYRFIRNAQQVGPFTS
jgi:hypothetical protein